ncbi:MAG: glutathione peroxidase [Planctomycetes bacterium]|nr:glutathione peroxidase [Planctomycetota bacterium]MCC7172016.1 glutathione peroxidase [Planctomycetota bacterium]
MKTFLKSIAAALLALPGCSRFFETKVTEDPSMKDQSIHSVAFKTLEGKDASFADWAGKVVLVVNVASECGYTPQYEGLEKLWKEKGSSGLVVVGFPSNEFGGQEPGTAADIRTFCTQRFGVTFPLAEKCETKAGPSQSPVYKLLGGATGSLPGWNFCKYLVGKDGKVIGFWNSKAAPDSAELRSAIDKALAS